jgi:hypothetical protein
MAVEKSTSLRNTRDPVFFHLQVPCLCDYRSFSQGGLKFSDISANDVTRDGRVNRSQMSKETSSKSLAYVQAWLFFALLEDISKICGVQFDSSEFVDHTLKDGKFITMQHLRKYIWYWIGAEHPKTIDQRKADLSRFTKNLAIVNKTAFVLENEFKTTPNADIVMLSIIILADSLHYTSHQIFQMGPIKRTLKWGLPQLGDKLLVDSGWCIGELSSLITHCPPSVLLYLSAIDRRRKDKDHSKCSRSQGCLVNRLDVRTYVPSHAQDCHTRNCEFIEAPVRSIRQVLEKGGIPLVKISPRPGSGEYSIEVSTFVLGDRHHMPPYVAISHVWSDGMGNPRINALRSCQLRRIQRRVNQLYGWSDQNHPFWMDTLCVPLRDDIRGLAISRMAKTFMHADRVLVLDNFLEGASSAVDTAQLLIRVTHCDWNTRLWTFQEAMLAKNCHFQLNDVAVTLDDFRSHTSYTKSLLEVSNILSQEDEADVLRHQYTMDLILALTTIDDLARERRDKYAILPQQQDPDEEELRQAAIESCQKNAYVDDIFDRWAPITSRIQQNAANPEVYDSLRTHIYVALLDPILVYGMDSLFRMRGMFYDFDIDRSKDALDGASRQITGFTSKPESLLQDVARGLLGRTTSRYEDETICLGGLIGLDVSPMLKFPVRDQYNTKDVHHARVERMKTFLSLVKHFPTSILFWESPRLEDQGWRWAPLTFIHKKACASMFGRRGALCTPEGLRATCNGIRLKYQQTSADDEEPRNENLKAPRGETTTQAPAQWYALLAIMYADDETGSATLDSYPFRRSWQIVGLRQRSPLLQRLSQRAFWDQYFRQTTNDLGIIVDENDPDGLEGVIVEILKEDQGVVYCRYLANVFRLYRTKPQELRPFFGSGVELQRPKIGVPCLGYWMQGQEWCIG